MNHFSFTWTMTPLGKYLVVNLMMLSLPWREAKGWEAGYLIWIRLNSLSLSSDFSLFFFPSSVLNSHAKRVTPFIKPMISVKNQTSPPFLIWKNWIPRYLLHQFDTTVTLGINNANITQDLAFVLGLFIQLGKMIIKTG